MGVNRSTRWYMCSFCEIEVETAWDAEPEGWDFDSRDGGGMTSHCGCKIA